MQDTGASKSVLLQGVLPLSNESFPGGDALIRGCEMSYLRAPLRTTGFVSVGLHPYLHVKGVSLILGNNLNGEKVFPIPVVTDILVMSQPNYSTSVVPVVYPACVVTPAQSQRAEMVDLSEIFLVKLPGTTKPELLDLCAVKTENADGEYSTSN